jgi:hypothetical protein
MIRPFPTVRADGAQAIGAVAEQRSWIPGSALDIVSARGSLTGTRAMAAHARMH